MNKQTYYALALGAVIFAAGLVLGLATHSSQPKDLGTLTLNPYAVTRYPNCLASGDAAQCFLQNSLASATSSIFMQNNDKSSRFITLAQLSEEGTASSSYKMYVGTTTAPSVLSDYTAPTAAGLINGQFLATSTNATTTTNYDSYGAGGSGSPMSRVVEWKAGEWVYFKLQTASIPDCGSAGGGTGCEPATSTNKGFTPALLLEYNSTTTRQR